MSLSNHLRRRLFRVIFLSALTVSSSVAYSQDSGKRTGAKSVPATTASAKVDNTTKTDPTI